MDTPLKSAILLKINSAECLPARSALHCTFFAAIAARLLLLLLLFMPGSAPDAAQRELRPVVPGHTLAFPRDFGAHPDFRTEWWYATGWLETPDQRVIGFQITFFRSATDHTTANPSKFAPKQLIIAHAALSDPAAGRLLHDQKSAREGFGLAYAREGNTDIKVDDWHMVRDANGQYRINVAARDFSFTLSLSPTQPLLLQGQSGFFRKGPKAEHASYYYSEPQLRVTGTIQRDGKSLAVKGHAWLDHEWGTTVLDPDAVGWDWTGVNLANGSALMAIQIRSRRGDKIWAHATLRDTGGRIMQFGFDEVEFTPRRVWRSPRTQASYPVEMMIRTGNVQWHIVPLQEDQELDSRKSTGIVYWEGAVRVLRDGQPAGQGYLELTGYVKPLRL